ncbi:coproporphyrinogen III oxidase [Bifidobacterium margollesii]|uniref:Heme chaperone HemW n=1 Tax=Bifidobacterium margollesii TaxID=2020964 RepID=A0A2N5J9K9_9BIFI|nr:radical SAM family heme chaperone HemW [Bifidobacterium margollesii]PLS30896.1 coproporphyrinogen III oxidase [Bifidobacterium margollesii]
MASDFEVYIHVPFCLRRCGYCDFNTYTAPDLGGGASRGNYANMVIREMGFVREWQERHGVNEPPAGTVFFGGGTPTVLSAADLNAMLDAVRRIWGLASDAEITTEANPDTVDDSYIAELAEGGFTRVSFGMQSAVPHVLRTLDRTHTPANVEAGVKAADRHGLRSSVDLIYGAPGESLDDWRTSVRTAVDLGVDHISAYALTVEPTTKMGRQIAAGTIPRPDDDDEAAKYEIADELFSNAGLEWYEVSNWARPGYESRHNLGYWRNVDWAGLGPGAHSHYNACADAASRPPLTRGLSAQLTGGETESPTSQLMKEQIAGMKALRAWDIAHPRVWGVAVNEGRVPWAGSEEITPVENLEELIMLGLRIREGLDLDRINRAIASASAGVDDSSDSIGLRPIEPDRIKPMVDEGLITVEAGHAIPTRRGRLLNDAVIERFFALIGM